MIAPIITPVNDEQGLGDAVLTGVPQRPGTSTALFVVALLIVPFLAFGEYTRKEEVQGRASLKGSPADIFAPATGTVVRQLVHEGESVKAGQPLLVLSTDRSIATGSSRETMGISLRAQVRSRRRPAAGERYSG
ncbi:biotin/lipoyl-containing protein [Paraburkholderia phenazinium]|jgi:membrane fusion protein|uniref:biotin/lipoyl-containing protein n=1 Tax=Paraburkholderia phenazinium TaxID=60549 RepID=UPI000B853CE3